MLFLVVTDAVIHMIVVVVVCSPILLVVSVNVVVTQIARSHPSVPKCRLVFRERLAPAPKSWSRVPLSQSTLTAECHNPSPHYFDHSMDNIVRYAQQHYWHHLPSQLELRSSTQVLVEQD